LPHDNHRVSGLSNKSTLLMDTAYTRHKWSVYARFLVFCVCVCARVRACGL